MLRTGDEPLHARSPLRLRLGLALWGLAWAVGGAVAFSSVGRPGWAAACAVVAALAVLDLGCVLRRLRQGPHYQPGRDVPPYEPLNGGAAGARHAYGGAGRRSRRRRAR
ncbi:DUF6343 family protein [Streptomyces sp. 71268]|uniref:DUF6343 family protein n=1 Tax=Streptomyces sp. 71268 TaxID=3002640 RepID=UPI0023F7A56E|nr:DUF6343 family protein [Streptomyces sp. 71268]WEV29987.1 DUF6343 family protein [Streptomyces sp. 71268]